MLLNNRSCQLYEPPFTTELITCSNLTQTVFSPQLFQLVHYFRIPPKQCLLAGARSLTVVTRSRVSPYPSSVRCIYLLTIASQLGYGTWQSSPGEVSVGIYEALKAGYKHLVSDVGHNTWKIRTWLTHTHRISQKCNSHLYDGG